MSSIENPYQAPQVYSPPFKAGAVTETAGLWRHGPLLVMHKSAPLPARCVKSNVPTARSLKRSLTWHHPAVYIALLFNLLIYVILAVVLSKRATIYIGLSDEWFARRRRAMLIGWGSVLGSVAMFAAGIAMLDRPDAAGGWLLLGSAVTFIVGAVYGLIAARMVSPTRITDDYIWLKGVHRDFLATLPDWPYQI
jgi:hypothetical protein